MLGRVCLLLIAALCFCGCTESDVKRGKVALDIGDFDRAVTNFSKALDADPGNRDARYGLALAYYAIAENKEHVKQPTRDLWERTVREFKILSKIDMGGSINGAYSTSLFYLARATLAENSRANVVPMLDQSIALDSLNFFSYNLKALILGNAGSTEEAKEIFVYIVAKNPEFASAYVNLGNLYWSEGDVESAWDIWSMGHVALPDNKVLAHWTSVAEDSLKSMVESGEL